MYLFCDEIRAAHNVSRGYDMEAMHIHDVYEIYMAQSDGLKFFVNDRVYLLGRGDVMLFDNSDLHKISVAPNEFYDRYVITFPPKILRGLQGEGAHLLDCFEKSGEAYSHKVSLGDEQQQFLRDAAQSIAQEAGQDMFARTGQALKLCEILVMLNRARAESGVQPMEMERNMHAQVRIVIAYIDENFTQDISLDELGAICFLNKSYLCRLFKRETGFRIHDYIIYRRLSYAMNLMRAGKSVSVAAHTAGFGSDTFFITTFRKQLGVTPYQFMLTEKSRRAI